jgi:hypothetical protein
VGPEDSDHQTGRSLASLLFYEWVPDQQHLIPNPTHHQTVPDRDQVELGVQLLERLEHAELPLAAAIDRIETITSNPATTREILDVAEMRGAIERKDGIVHIASGNFLSFQSEVIKKDGKFSCRRCGANISTGYFMKMQAGELGPFGSSCIRKVTGRD